MRIHKGIKYLFARVKYGDEKEGQFLNYVQDMFVLRHYKNELC